LRPTANDWQRFKYAHRKSKQVCKSVSKLASYCSDVYLISKMIKLVQNVKHNFLKIIILKYAKYVIVVRTNKTILSKSKKYLEILGYLE